MITKEQILKKISLVKERREGIHIHEMMNKIETFVKEQDEFCYHSIMQFIENQKTLKAGGYHIAVNKAIRFLKNEIRIEYKASKDLK